MAAELTRMNGADIIVDHLVKEGMPYLFGVCGHGNVGFLDAAFKASDKIKTISVHHEQSAGYMADAYYKVKHEPVATFTSCGPGSCNLVIALASAMMDSAAYLAITANVPTNQFNRLPFQETGLQYQADFPSVIRPYIKRSFQPTRTEMVPLAVRQATQLLRSGRPGPVNLDVPLNVFVEEADVALEGPMPRLAANSPGDPNKLKQALDLLLAAERPVVVAGQGAILAEASAELLEFCKLTGIPVVTSPNGKGVVSEREELCYGCIGRNGPYAANEATRNADVLLAIGFSFDDRATSAWLDGYTFARTTKLIHIDIEPSEIGRNYPPFLGIVGEAKASLRILIDQTKAVGQRPQSRIAGWISKLNDNRDLWKRYQQQFVTSDQMPVRPERLMEALKRAVPENAIIASDVGVHHNWVIQLWETLRPRQLLHSWGFAAMGYATSGILGAKLAAPDRPCVAVVGDGSFLMTPHALATAVEYDIPVVWVVWNNYGYGSIRDLQHGFFKGRELATSFRHEASGAAYNPDFAALAQAFGVEAVTIKHPSELEDAIARGIAANRPYLIEVPVAADIRPIGTGTWELPPLGHHEPNFLTTAEKMGLTAK